MAITMTDFAIDKIMSMMKIHPNASCLRIGLQSGGCSGFKYMFEFVENPDENDKILEFNDLKVCVDKKSYLFLNGMEIDYEESLFKSGIKLNNPRAKRTCGCGESIAF